MKNIKTVSILCLSTTLFLCSCGTDQRDFSSYSPATEYCYSELNKTGSGMNKVCNLNNVKNSKNNLVKPFNSDLIYSLFPYEKLTLDSVYDIELSMGEKAINLHKYFDRHNEYLDKENNIINNLKVINDSYATGTKIKVPDDLFNILKISLEIGEISKGRFNIAIGELSDFWNDLIDQNKNDISFYDPDLVSIYNPSLSEEERLNLESKIKDELKEKINKLVEDTPSIEELKNILVLDEKNKTVEFKKYNNAEKVSLSLGGIGKGYAIGVIKDVLLEKGYNNGYLSGATSSNIILGNHYKNKNWTIGISSPSKKDFNLGGNLKLNGYTLISTSGDEVNSYGFYDENSNPVIRHHIIDATSGYPLNNFRKVTIVSKTLSSEIMDALSTILINTSSKDVENVLKTMRNHYNADIEAIFQQTNSDETEYYYSITQGLKNNFEVNKDNPTPAKVYYYEF